MKKIVINPISGVIMEIETDKELLLLEDCGSGAGGFKPGNSCGKGKSGGGGGIKKKGSKIKTLKPPSERRNSGLTKKVPISKAPFTITREQAIALSVRHPMPATKKAASIMKPSTQGTKQSAIGNIRHMLPGKVKSRNPTGGYGRTFGAPPTKTLGMKIPKRAKRKRK